MSELTPAEQRVIDAADKLSYNGLLYDQERGGDTPIPTCAGCGVSDWLPDRIKHPSNCTVQELIAAVRALRKS